MYGIRDEYAPMFGRQVLTVWSGAFCSDLDATAWELPNGGGYMLDVMYGPNSGSKVRVECPSPRTDSNFHEVDAALDAAMREA